VRGIDLTVEQGEVLALLGPNGAGKTSTVEVLEGYRRRSAGAVSVLGIDPARRSTELRQRIGVVLQESQSDPYLTVREVVRKHAAYYRRPRQVDEVLALAGLTEKADARVRSLSGGQRRRLDLALGIVGRPELLFLDEPTTGFDPSARRSAWEVVQGLTTDGTTVLLTTHYMDEAQALAHRVVVMTRGQVVAEGTPNSLGGRERQGVLIRFRCEQTPPPPAVSVEGRWEIRTADEVRVLNDLTHWALTKDIELEGLVVERPSLEDVYLELVR
jgi:ABC-2 type transport system ATP-binding protein